MRTGHDLKSCWFLSVGLAGCVEQAPAPDNAPDLATSARPNEPSEPWFATIPDEPVVPPRIATTPDEPVPPPLHGTIRVAEGDFVTPQTKLHLFALPPDGQAAVSYEWRAEQPNGSVSTFLPANDIAYTTFETNVAGDYRFHVTMTLASGMRTSAALMVAVIPDAAVHIELLWRTPGDADESDTGFVSGAPETRSAGSDVDLHFVNSARDHHRDAIAAARESWFFEQRDCNWLNPNPEWGSVGPLDNPSLDRDDTDGGGPENVNFSILETDRCYLVGVHYWKDWGYGQTFATVRVYLNGSVAAELTTTLLGHSLWTVGTVCDEGGDMTFGDHRICPRTGEPCQSDTDCGGESCESDVIHNFELPLELQLLFGP